MAEMVKADLNKTRIAQQFSRAAKTYNSAADVQLDIAFDAMRYISSHYECGLDIGCGTGRISQKLMSQCDILVAIDLAFGMLTYAQQSNPDNESKLNWVQGDADCLPLADNSVDMIFSSMALQWSSNQHQVMAEIARVMTPSSHAVLAIMCDGSFEQLHDSWRIIDTQRHINKFASAQTWYNAAQSQGLQVSMQQKQYVTWHPNLRQLLSSIKSIGANVLLSGEGSADKSVFNRHLLQHLEASYQQKYAENMQLPLTYQVCVMQCYK